MSFEEIYKQVDSVEGWMGKSDCKALYEYAKDINGGLIVEIGSYMGRSTKLLALSSPTSKIIAIDQYKDNAYFQVSGDEVKRRFTNNTKELNISLIHKSSTEASKTWTLPIDFLHIDGDHLYEQVKEDITLFAPHVKKGRYVFLHDHFDQGEHDGYNPNRHGVYKALKEIGSDYFDEIKTDINSYGFAICKKK